MESIKRTILIDAPKAAVWSALANFQGVGDFHPYITSVELNTEHNGGLGSKRTCYFNDDTKVDEEVVDWREGERYTVHVTNFSFPLKTLHGILGVRELDGKSEAFMAMEYEPKFGLLGKLMNVMLMKSAMSTRIDNILKGLETAVTTGRPVKKVA